MQFSRQSCLSALFSYLIAFGLFFIVNGGAVRLFAQAPAPAGGQAAPPPQKKQNPFESVPQAETPKPVPPPPAAPVKPGQVPIERPTLENPAAVEAPKAPAEDVIESIEFRGARRVPQDTLKALIFTKKGDKYEPETLNRDFMALWNTGRFDDLRLEREAGTTGWVLRWLVTERRVVRSIKYDGAKSVTVSEILDRFKERRVGLQVESQYDPNKVQRAANVLKEYLAERGRQFATVTPEVRQIPPSSLEVTFKVTEGPKVKVGRIDIEGNTVFSDKVVRRAMKNLKAIGIPKSIVAEELFSKTFDSSKLEEDKDRIRQFYQERGYFSARATESSFKIRDTVPGKIRPLIVWPKGKPGKAADLSITVEEGRRYRLNKINFIGVKFFRTPESLFRPVFGMGEGDVFSTQKLQKGLEQLRKLYGEFGFLDMVPEPGFEPQPNSDKIDLSLSVDEGKQFFVRRLDFAGNTTTRDKVIRREVLIDEGDLFNSRLWEISLLRLNQLGYFEVLKEQESATITRDTKNNTVDVTLKVKERGKNSVQLSGGVSGIAGSFVSFGYSTNNFLGLGETLSLDSQIGDRIRSVSFGFTEPYFLDKPIQVGFTVSTQRFNYNQGREVSLLSGRNLIPQFNSLGANNLLNYVSNGYGFTTFGSTVLKRSFARLTLTYAYNVSSIRTESTSAETYFRFINFQGLDGPNQLAGIKSSGFTPSYTFNTIDHPVTPSRGKSLFISAQIAGAFLGGNVNEISPTLEYKHFRAGFKKGHVIGTRILGRYITGFGGRSAPPFSRFYMGGENDIRGFDIWSVSPFAYLPSEGTVNVLNADGSARTQRVIESGNEITVPVTLRIPTYQLTFIGGDTQLLNNLEYRIPIFGPVVLAAFIDTGVNRVTNTGQLNLNKGRVDELNALFPQAGFDRKIPLALATQKLRMSTGIEMQIMMPVVNAPFRFYWAYNPSRNETFLQPPIVADRSYFPNQATFLQSVAIFGRASPLFERARVFRFTISRTF